jgi:hypothetical protein
MEPESTPPVSESSEYQDLLASVACVLPLDANGTRRPADRGAVRVYWEVGRLLNEYLAGRASYGQRAVARLAADLGLLPRTLYRARKVHERLPADVSTELSWSHCRLLVTVEDDDARHRLMARAAAAGWSVRRLQQHLSAAPSVASAPILSRPGTYRIIAAIDEMGVAAPAFDLGFGIRRPLELPGKPGKKTRRLLRELAPGDTVECTTDDKGRPALRRVWGQTESRLYAYTATRLQAVAPATLQLQLNLGFAVMYECRARLRAPADKLSRQALEAAVASTDLPVFAHTLQLTRGQGYAVDLYHLNNPAEPVLLNRAWVS